MKRLFLLLSLCVAVSCSQGRKEDQKGRFESAALPLLQTLDARIAECQNMDESSENYGAIFCPSCGEYHSRAAEAILPFACEYSITGNEDMLHRTLALADWLIARQEESGAWLETPGTWTGTTADQLHSLLMAYPIVDSLLSDPQKVSWLESMRGAADYLTGVMDNDFAYINYCATTACCLAESYLLFDDDRYRDKATALARFCVEKMNSDNLLEGEGENQGDGKTGVDIGYNLDMSLWGLARYASLLDDAEVMEEVKKSASAHLGLVFPDGSIDCSSGLRSCKWGLWGSVTADGIYPLCAILGSEEPVYITAAVRNINLLKSCIQKDGLVAPGPEYDYIREVPPCIYATFSRAKGLAMALSWLEKDVCELAPMPCDSEFVAEYPSMGGVVARKGNFCTSIVAYDYKSSKGSASRFMHRPSGGTVGLMWAEGYGTVQLASQNEYRQWETIHFPEMEGMLSTSPRIEYVSDGRTFTNVYDYDVKFARDADYRYMATGWLKDSEGESGCVKYGIKYQFNYTDGSFAKRYYLISDKECVVRIIEPVLVDDETSFGPVDNHTVRFTRSGGSLTVKAEDRAMLPDPDGNGPYSQLFPSVRAIPLIVEVPVGTETTSVVVVFSARPAETQKTEKNR